MQLQWRPRSDAPVTMFAHWGEALVFWASVAGLVVLAIIAAPEGIARVVESHPDVDIHVGVIDERLTPEPQGPEDPPEGYIVPGLGDAGDRQFGTG